MKNKNCTLVTVSILNMTEIKTGQVFTGCILNQDTPPTINLDRFILNQILLRIIKMVRIILNPFSLSLNYFFGNMSFIK